MATAVMTTNATSHGRPAAGIYSDMSLDGPDIGTLVLVIDRAKNLPNRKTLGKQDPYCAARLGKEARKTETDWRGGQTPRWDQELRFKVFDSPDYYKLKVSCFNEDKRSDLIGESWVDLREIIKPGGGQSDAWLHLEFRNKYAGEVRIELTYYDSRPKPEPTNPPPTSDRSVQEGHDQEHPGYHSGRRKEKPVRRRPLPSQPSTPAATPSPHLEVEQSNDTQQHRFGPRTYRMTSSDRQSLSPGTSPHQSPNPEASESTSPTSSSAHEFSSWNDPQLRRRPISETTMMTPVSTQTQPPYPEFMYGDVNALPATHNSAPDRPISEFWVDRRFNKSPDQLDSSPSVYMVPSQTSYDERGLFLPDTPVEVHPRRRSLTHANTDPAIGALGRRARWSAEQTSPYQSGSNAISPSSPPVATPNGRSLQPTVEDEEETDCPPPPPAHRSSAPAVPLHGSSVSPASPNSPPTASQAPGWGPMPNQQPPLSSATEANTVDIKPRPARRIIYYNNWNSSPSDTRGFAQSVQQSQIQPSPSMPNLLIQNCAPPAVPYRPPQQTNRNSMPANLRGPPSSMSYPHINSRATPPRHPLAQQFIASPPQTIYNGSCENEGPPIIKPRAISPGPTATPSSNRAPGPMPRTTPQRKSISPLPTPSVGSSASTPYSPDSFDAFNPATHSRPSSSTNANSPRTPASTHTASSVHTPSSATAPTSSVATTTTSQTSTSATTNTTAASGPITTSSGRVVDPSDHLPSSTWAPEPERQRHMPAAPSQIGAAARAQRAAPKGPSPNGPSSVSGSSKPHPAANAQAATPAPLPMTVRRTPWHAAPTGTAVPSPLNPQPAARNRLLKKNRPRSTAPETAPQPQPQPQPRMLPEPSLPTLIPPPASSPHAHAGLALHAQAQAHPTFSPQPQAHPVLAPQPHGPGRVMHAGPPVPPRIPLDAPPPPLGEHEHAALSREMAGIQIGPAPPRASVQALGPGRTGRLW